MAGADAQNGLHPIDKQLLDQSQWDFSDLKAIFIDCTLKRSPAVSNTQALADRSIAIMRHAGVEVDVIRSIDHDIATGVYPDMTKHGWDRSATRRPSRALRDCKPPEPGARRRASWVV